MFTRETILKIDLTGDKDTVTCNDCGEVLILPFPFMPFKYKTGKILSNKKPETIVVKSRQHLLKNFLERHYGRYMVNQIGRK